MNKLVFKNNIINIIIGTILTIASIVGYFLDWFTDYLPLVIGVVLILVSLKRFFSTFKKVENKKALLVLSVELLIDVALGGLLVYTKENIELYTGGIVYVRGLSYFIVTYYAKRTIALDSTIFNILFITLGSFLLFTTLDITDFIIYGVAVLILILGLLNLGYGIHKTMQNKKTEPKTAKEELREIMDQVDSKIDDDIDEEEKEEPTVIEEVTVNELTIEPEEDDEEEPKKEETVDYNEMTVAELKQLAKEHNLSGYSSLKKQELISFLKENI
jgi:hypothetical protein